MALRELARDRISVGSPIVLSDGADVGSSLSAADVTSRARRARARVYAVGARSRTFAATRCARWPPGAAAATPRPTAAG